MIRNRTPHQILSRETINCGLNGTLVSLPLAPTAKELWFHIHSMLTYPWTHVPRPCIGNFNIIAADFIRWACLKRYHLLVLVSEDKTGIQSPKSWVSCMYPPSNWRWCSKMKTRVQSLKRCVWCIFSLYINNVQKNHYTPICPAGKIMIKVPLSESRSTQLCYSKCWGLIRTERSLSFWLLKFTVKANFVLRRQFNPVSTYT
jgi:hypothetical protein